MVVGMGEEQERLIRMEMQRKQDELKVKIATVYQIQILSGVTYVAFSKRQKRVNILGVLSTFVTLHCIFYF